MCKVGCVLLRRGWVETIGHDDVIVHTSEVRGMIAPEEKVEIPSNNDVLKIGQDRSVEILTKVILENVDSVLSGVKGFTNVDGSIVKADELKDITNSRRKILEGIRRDDYAAVEGSGEP
jgi:hypothetical protein